MFSSGCKLVVVHNVMHFIITIGKLFIGHATFLIENYFANIYTDVAKSCVSAAYSNVSENNKITKLSNFKYKSKWKALILLENRKL